MGFLTMHLLSNYHVFHSSAALMQVTDQRQAWKGYYQGWQDAHPGTSIAEPDFLWALECVRSRAFSGPWSGASLPCTACCSSALTLTLVTFMSLSCTIWCWWCAQA